MTLLFVVAINRRIARQNNSTILLSDHRSGTICVDARLERPSYMKTHRLIISALLLSISLTACNCRGFAEAKRPHYAMVVFSKGSEIFNWAYAGFQDAARAVGATTELRGPADIDAYAVAGAVDELAAEGVSGIAVTAPDAATLVASINGATAKKIPVVTFDSDAPKSARLLFVGTETYNVGFAAGKALGEELGDEAVVGVSTEPGLDTEGRRLQGFRDGLASAAKSAKIVAQVNDAGDSLIAESMNAAMLEMHPEINAIYCVDGNCPVGALAATRDVGRDQGDKKVRVLALSIDVPVLKGVEAGDFDFTVAQNPYAEGVQAFLELWSAAHPTPFESLARPGFGQTQTANHDTGVRILRKGDPSIKALMTPPKL